MDVETPEPSMQLLAEAAETQPPAVVPSGVGADDDSRSSSLSDIEDGAPTDISNGNEEVGIGTEEEEDDAEEEEEEEEVEDEDEEEDDTEAETERLEASPEKHRKQRKVVLSADPETNDGSVADGDNIDPPVTRARGRFGNLNQETEDQDDDANLQTSDISTPADTADMSDQEESSKTAGRKRKREEDDTTAKSLKKVALELANHVTEEADAADGDGSPVGSGEANEDVALGEEEGSGHEDHGEDQPEEDHATIDMPVDGVDSNADEAEGEEGGQDTVNAARTQEDLEKRKAALDSLFVIERDFALLRDRLFADRSNQLNQEMATIDTDNPTHPLYLSVLSWLNQLREEKVEQAKMLFRYKFAALQKRSVTNRASLQSQYMQRMRELRDETLEKASEEWYQIQRERRNFEMDRDTSVNHFVGDRMQWVASQTAYNKEVSILSGISKYVGFPAAPEILGAKETVIDEDLKRMGIARSPVAASNLAGPAMPRHKPAAEEQFIADTPWANPQHQHSQLLTSIHRQASNGMQPSSPLNTPAAQKQVSDPVPNGSASTIAALPTSSLAPTPMSGEKSKDSDINLNYTPSRPPMGNHSARLDIDQETAGAIFNGGNDPTPHDKDRPEHSKVQQPSALPTASGSQPPKDAAPMQGQFPQNPGLPPVKVGTV